MDGDGVKNWSENDWRRLDAMATLPIFAAGSALHFAFEWSGGWPPLALIAAVNESVWEHLKIAFWPALLWAAVQLWLGRPRRAGYWAARGIGLLAISLTIVVVFYSYTAVFGGNLLLVDIATFGAAILVGQLIANFSLSAVSNPGPRLLGRAALAAQIAAFSAFTFAPPPLPLFEDGRNGGYGLAAYEGATKRR